MGLTFDRVVAHRSRAGARIALRASRSNAMPTHLACAAFLLVDTEYAC